jgi:glucose-6-phosphate dehydrogenase assembly protein OpcA
LSALAQTTAGEAAWSAEGTTPDAIEGALRDLLVRRARDERASSHGGLVPARVLNMIVFVPSDFAAETSARLDGVGRYHASRTVVLSYEPARERLDARITVATEEDRAEGELGLLRETVLVEIGRRHLDDLVTIADPLVLSDLPTVLWSPHGHAPAAGALLELAQTALIDSLDETERSRNGWRAAMEHACALSDRLYVVDLAWLRSTPWRERIAATFDPKPMRSELESLSRVTVTHHRDSTVAAMLLVGWLASRLGWELDRAQFAETYDEDTLLATASAAEREIELLLRTAPELEVPGLQTVQLGSACGQQVGLDRGPGGLRLHRRGPEGNEQGWALLGASRGEGGILGEGIRQALLRDPTYRPALNAARAMLP